MRARRSTARSTGCRRVKVKRFFSSATHSGVAFSCETLTSNAPAIACRDSAPIPFCSLGALNRSNVDARRFGELFLRPSALFALKLDIFCDLHLLVEVTSSVRVRDLIH